MTRYFLVSHDGTILLRDYDGKPADDGAGPARVWVSTIRARCARGRGRTVRAVHAAATSAQAGPWAAVYLQDVHKGLDPTCSRARSSRSRWCRRLRRALINSPGIQQPAFGYQRVLVSCGATYVPKKVWGFADVERRRLGLLPGPGQAADLLPGAGRRGPRGPADAELHPPDARRGAGLRRLPRAADATPQPSSPPRRAGASRRTRNRRSGACRASATRAIVQPVLDKHCVECHSPLKKDGKVDLTGDRTDYFNVAYETLARAKPGPHRQPVRELDPDLQRPGMEHPGDHAEVLGLAGQQAGRVDPAGHPDEKGKPRVNIDDAAGGGS